MAHRRIGSVALQNYGERIRTFFGQVCEEIVNGIWRIVQMIVEQALVLRFADYAAAGNMHCVDAIKREA